MVSSDPALTLSNAFRSCCVWRATSSSSFLLVVQHVVVVGLDLQQGLDPGPQLGLVHRLVEEIVGAGFQGFDAVGDVLEGGHHDDRDDARLRIRLQSPGHLESVHARHGDVQQDQVGPVPGDAPERRGPVRRKQDGVPQGGEEGFDQTEVPFLIVHDQYLSGGAHDPMSPLRW